MLLVGETMPQVFRGETTMLEHFRSSGLLDEYYAHAAGAVQSSLWIGQVVKQITDRHPHLNVLEIGEMALLFHPNLLPFHPNTLLHHNSLVL